MGYSLSWLAVRGKTSQAVRDELGFRLTDGREEIPESDLTGVEIPTGWYLIVSNRSDQVAPDEKLQRLSNSGGEVVTCFVEEHVMFSSAVGWEDGCKAWSVIHNAQAHRDHLEAQGDLPTTFSSILAELQAKQQAADANKQRVDFIFDVPVTLAQSVVGYRYDANVPGLSGPAFEVLLADTPVGSAPSRKPSLLKRLFGV